LELDSALQATKVIPHMKRRIYEFIVDETLIKVGNELVWVWIAIEDKTTLGICISYERSICLLQNNSYSH
jgi:transposase-like protein